MKGAVNSLPSLNSVMPGAGRNSAPDNTALEERFAESFADCAAWLPKMVRLAHLRA